MSEFHWITLALALSVVGGVWGLNLWQEWRFKRRTQAAFAKSHTDVLLDAPKNMVRHGEATTLRLEPSLLATEQVLGESLECASEHVNLRDEVALAVALLDPAFDYVAEVHPADWAVGNSVPKIEIGKRIRILGLTETDEWEVLVQDSRYQELRIGVQLVDRQGALSEAQMIHFCELINAYAERLGGVATFPRREDKLRVARELDSFCAEVDMQIGLNIVTGSKPFAQGRISAIAELAGLQLESDGCWHARSESGKSLFTLQDRHQRSMQTLEETPAITLLLDVPRVAAGEEVFDRMCDLAQQLALTLGGDLVDDDNRSLKPTDLASIRKQLSVIYSKMDERGISAGGVVALRLFA